MINWSTDIHRYGHYESNIYSRKAKAETAKIRLIKHYRKHHSSHT